MRRRSSNVPTTGEASALRKAVQQSDPKTLASIGPVSLEAHDMADRKHVLFYQDEGGLQGTDSRNEPLSVIYYLGVIDICTPYSFVKRVEHFWKGLREDKHAISAVPPIEYADRFLSFLLSVMPGCVLSPRRGVLPRN